MSIKALGEMGGTNMKHSNEVVRLGMEVGKNTFHLVGVDETGLPAVKKKLRRKQVLVWFANLPACLVAMGACGGRHYWSREIGKLGHDVRLNTAKASAIACRSGSKNLNPGISNDRYPTASLRAIMLTYGLTESIWVRNSVSKSAARHGNEPSQQP